MGLKLWGELANHNAQRFLLPIIYSLAVSVLSHCVWLGATTIVMIAPLCLGYKTYGSNDAVARAFWLAVICATAALGPFLTHHLAWWVFFPYLGLSGLTGALTRNINNLVGAPINGFLIGCPILFIHA